MRASTGLALFLAAMMPATTLTMARAAAQRAITVTRARRALIQSESAARFVLSDLYEERSLTNATGFRLQLLQLWRVGPVDLAAHQLHLHFYGKLDV